MKNKSENALANLCGKEGARLGLIAKESVIVTVTGSASVSANVNVTVVAHLQ